MSFRVYDAHVGELVQWHAADEYGECAKYTVTCLMSERVHLSKCKRSFFVALFGNFFLCMFIDFPVLG